MRRAASPSGFTLIEILIVMALVGIVSVACCDGHSERAVCGGKRQRSASLRTINQAQFAFIRPAATRPTRRRWSSLGTPPPVGVGIPQPRPDAADPLQKSGYRHPVAGPVKTDDVTDLQRRRRRLVSIRSLPTRSNPGH